MLQIINVKRSSEKEINQAISDLQKRGFECVTDIIPVAQGQIVTIQSDNIYTNYFVRMQREWEK